MPIWSSQISQQAQANYGMASAQLGYAQQLSSSYGFPGMGASGQVPPPPPPISIISAPNFMAGGLWGEQMAASMGSSAFSGMQMASSLGVAGLGLASLAGGPVGWAAGAATLPVMAAGAGVQIYGGAFQSGMLQQAALNSTLRNNFQFMGGAGPMGRGFSQAQMGGIGQMISQEVRNNAFTSVGEMNQLIGMGADAGMFTAVRDVQQFTQKFKSMLDTLRDVQRELGGSLTDAMSFVRESRQMGIFQGVDRVNFAQQLRGAMSTTGMSQSQLMQSAAWGAQLSRSIGGLGRQGAVGALRTVSSLGSAVSAGVISEEALSEATGGLTGADALQAFSQSMMANTARFSRRAAGRFSIFAASNERGTGLDQDAVDAMISGDMSIGDIRRRAHENVGGMGRARAINQEGRLRGALLEQGGMAAQVNIWRNVLGDRIMNQGDDLASLVLQRRMGVDRNQAEIMMSMIRNQDMIAGQERIDRVGSARQQEQSLALRDRSPEAVLRQIERSVQEVTGLNTAREAGRNFVSRVSELADRVMRDIVGAAETSITNADQRVMDRVAMGGGTRGDRDRFGQLVAMARGAGGDTSAFFATSMFGGASIADRFSARGVDIRGMGGADVISAARAAEQARSGLVFGDDAVQMRGLLSNRDDFTRRVVEARMRSRGNAADFYKHMGGSANAVDAAMAQLGMAQVDESLSVGAVSNRGGGALGLDTVMSDLRSESWSLSGMGLSALTMNPALFALSAASPVHRLAQAAAGLSTGGIAAAADASGLASLQAMVRDSDRADAAIARGVGGLGGVDPEQMAILRDNEGFRSAVQGVLGAGKEGRAGAMDALRRQMAGLSGSQFDAASLVLTRLQSGGKDAAVRNWVGSPTAQQRAALNAYNESISNWQAMAQALSGMEGIDGVQDAIGGVVAMGREFGDISMHAGMVRTQLASMDPSSPEYQELSRRVSEMGAGSAREMARGLLQQSRSDHAVMRELTGQGRRGHQGARESAIMHATGGIFGDMNLRVGGRRIRNIRQATDILARGGSAADRLATDMQQHLIDTGEVSTSEAERIMTAMRQTISGGEGEGEGSRLEGARQLRQLTQDSDGLQRIRQQALDQRARQQNPLNPDHRNLLEQIVRHTGEMARAGGGLKAGEG